MRHSMTLKPGVVVGCTSGERFLTFPTCFVAIFFPFDQTRFPFFPLDRAFVTVRRVHHSSTREKEKIESVSRGRKRRRGRRKRRGKIGGTPVSTTAHYPHTRALFFFFVHRSSADRYSTSIQIETSDRTS